MARVNIDILGISELKWTRMDEFLEMYNFPRLDREEAENMTRPITGNEIESIIKRQLE